MSGPYSGNLLHIDSHRTSRKHPHCQVVEDDASREIVAARETWNPVTNQDSIAGHGRSCGPCLGLISVVIVAVNTDRGSEFFSNQKAKNPDSKSAFEKYLEKKGIKHIPSSPNNPQTNGIIRTTMAGV